MAERLMFDTQKEPFWFPNYPSKRQGQIRFNQGHSSKCLYTDVVIFGEDAENYAFGHVIPSTLFEDTRLSENHPSQAIQKAIFEYIPNYWKLNHEEKCYGITHSPIQALEEKRGNCIHRASIGAAIAHINNVPYRIVGSKNLIPPLKSLRDFIYGYLTQYIVKRGLRSPRQTNILMLNLLQDIMQNPGYPHWWLEILEGGIWQTVDTVEWEPTSLPYFAPQVARKMVCKSGTLDQLMQSNLE